MPVWKTWPRRWKSEESLFNPRSSFQFFQFFDADCRGTSDGKVHEINWRAVDVGLPTPIAFPRPVKRVEGNLAYKSKRREVYSFE